MLRQIEETINCKRPNPHSRRRRSSPGPSRLCGSSPGPSRHWLSSSPAPDTYCSDNRETKSSPLKRMRSWSVISIDDDDDERPPKKAHTQDLSDEEVILVDRISKPQQSRKGKERVKPDGTLIFLGGHSTIVADDDFTVRPLVRLSLLRTNQLTFLNL